MQLPKILEKLLFMFALVLSAGPLWAQPAFDCHMKAGASEAQLFVHAEVPVSGQATAEAIKLRKIACSAVAGAISVAEAEGISAEWLLTLPIYLVENIAGQPVQAQFVRNPGAAEPRKVLVTRGIIQQTTDDELLFFLGHELGHGVHGHAIKKKALVAGAAVIGTPLSGLLLTKGIVRKAIGAAAAVGTGAAVVCGTAFLSPRYEIDADVFGIRVMEKAGVELANARNIGANALAANPEDAGSCLKGGRRDENPHPSTDARVKAIRALR